MADLVWRMQVPVPDASRDSCMACNSRFTLINR
jgi:hypothetical protein